MNPDDLKTRRSVRVVTAVTAGLGIRVIAAASIMRMLAGDKVIGSLLLAWAKQLETAATSNDIETIRRIRRALPVVAEDTVSLDMMNAVSGLVELLQDS